MKIYKIVEKKPEILGINFEEFMIWIFLSIILIALPTILAGIGINLGIWYYLLALFLIIALYKVLKKVGKKNYTGYIYSYISYTFLQPKKITSRYIHSNKKNGKQKHR